MRSLLCTLGLALLVIQPPLGAQDRQEGFQAAAERRLAALDVAPVPGFAYAVVDGDEVIELGAAGVKRLGGDAPVTPDTPFVVGSISKSFTALAVMQLVEAGRLTLDDPVSRHLPVFAGRPAGAVTVRQLLSHTSGYSTSQGHFSREGPSADPNVIARHTAQLAASGPNRAPGAQWEYSNANYVILGRLVEVLSGQPFKRYLETRILRPLGMDDSFVADGAVHPAMASGHVPWFTRHRPLRDNRTDLGTAPQGGVVSSARDLARYMRMMMNGESDLVSARAKAQMMAPASDVASFYGLGWFLNAQFGTAWHSGSSPGVETLMTLLPAQRKGVVVLVNAGSGIGFGETVSLRNGITAAALGLDYGSEGSRWGQKATFLLLLALPFFYLAAMGWAWRHRGGLRAKAGPFGLFSLWFPLLTTLAAAWVLLVLVPLLLGLPLGTLRVFYPDLVITMIAGAVLGVLWAAFRLAVAYTGRKRAS